MKRLRKEIVPDVRSDQAAQETQMTVHHCVTMSPDSGSPGVERETEGGAEYVEGESFATRSGTVQRSRDRSMFGFGFELQETDYLSDLRKPETSSFPKRPSKDTNNLHKKAIRNSSELAEPRRLLTACFGLVRKQETESDATQVVNSKPESGDRVALRTRETKRKLNPFLEAWEASATQEIAPKGIMPLERMQGLALPQPLSTICGIDNVTP